MLTHIHNLQRTQPHALKRKPVVGFHAGRESQLEKIRNILRGPVVQPQLKIGAPNDRYEQEADRVAEQVMRMPEPQLTASGGVIQRACTSCLEENKLEEGVVQTKPIVSLKPSSYQPSEFAQAPSIVHDILRSSGQPLDEQTRAFMEPRFGHDFSQVRIHTDDKAAESARAVNARAYTVGQDVVMRRGEYAPGTEVGRRLLAHELTHVIQQQSGNRLQKLQVGAVGDVCEQEAEGVMGMSPQEHSENHYTQALFVQRQPPQTDPIEEHFEKELQKELQGWKLRNSDKNDLRRQIIQSRIYRDISGERTTQDQRETELYTLTENLLCQWSRRRFLNNEPFLHLDPAFCLFAEVTASVMKGNIVKNFIQNIITPAYDDIVSNIVNEMNTHGLARNVQGKVSAAVPDQSKDLSGQSESIIFAMNLYREAGLESDTYGLDALRAIAQVVLNRVDAKFGANTKSVILKFNQFSWTGDKGAVDNALKSNKSGQEIPQWNRSIFVAFEALSGNLVAPTEAQNATFYFNPTAVSRPDWADACCFLGKFGHHCFYEIALGQVCKERDSRNCSKPKNVNECR